MKHPNFLTLAEVVEIHKNQIELYGGKQGIRDIGLLQSAISQPGATFHGEWLHPDILEMAAAYAFHICRNHPFIDGNKRAALATALVFLDINDIPVFDPKRKLLHAMLKISLGNLGKKEFADLLKNLPRKER